MTQVLCIGSVLWDIIGRSASHMKQGSDVPGRITRLPGGVALNIAMTLKRFGVDPVLLSSIGRDAEGHALITACEEMGITVGGGMQFGHNGRVRQCAGAAAAPGTVYQVLSAPSCM